MAALSKVFKIGIIAEEYNDVDVMYELTCKLISENSFSFAKFVGHGCGALRRKCGSWAKVLRNRGCSHLIILHDADRNNCGAIRKLLEDRIGAVQFRGTVILIPTEELEAWLLCDPAALKTVFKMRSEPSTPLRPETVPNPKEFLGELVRKSSNTRYINTVHNQRIAKALEISTLGRCPSFAAYPHFIQTSFCHDLQ